MEVKKANVLEMTPRTWGCFGLRVRRGVGTRTRVASSGGTGNKPGTRLGSGITGNRHGLSRDDLRWSGGCSQLDNIVRVRRVDVELRSSDLVSQAGQVLRRGKNEVTMRQGVRLAGIPLVRKEMSGSSIIFSRSKEGRQCSRRSSAYYYQPAPRLFVRLQPREHSVSFAESTTTKSRRRLLDILPRHDKALYSSADTSQ